MLDRETLPGEHTDERASLDTMLIALVKARGSDLHLTVGAPPTVRVHGDLVGLPEYELLHPSDTEMLLHAVASEAQWEQFQRTNEMDFAYSIEGVSRFRVNMFPAARLGGGAVFRAIPHEIKPLDELGVPESVARFASLPRASSS